MTNSVEPNRVAMIMGKMIGGGVEAVTMNYYRNIDRKKIQFDFIVDEDSTNIPRQEILELGGRILVVPSYKNILKYNETLDGIFKENQYSIVHSNVNSLSVFPLRIAKKNHIPIRIAHNHSTSSYKEILKNGVKYFLKQWATKYATHYMAPTMNTGKWLFGNEVEIKVLPNAIDLVAFRYDDIQRQKIRDELGYSSSDYVIGNVGRLVSQKNHLFLISVFATYKKENPDAKLLIIGEGPLKRKLNQLAKKLGVFDDVKILPNTSNISKMYSAMDLLIFPSLYEGLGMVAVEAQVSQLPVLLSDSVPNEVVISQNVYYLNLKKSITEWSNMISKIRIENSNLSRLEREFSPENYDIKKKAIELVDYYIKILS
ncbi:glycosyltransferase [Enterococcus casseliflavus]|uniref:glycosyltransferase n=1 Tax=Enterococcus casseliflavus TaxID=37734 RepID=UPI0035CB59C2